MTVVHLPDRLRLFAPAKLNLGFEVLGRRQDGYHDVATVMETVSIFDVIDLIPAESLRVVSDSGIAEENDLVQIGMSRLSEKTGIAFPVEVRIEKRIPIAAGLGGGSSDVGTILAALGDLLVLDPVTVREVAESLGSDVPFFLGGGVALATGTGINLTPIAATGRRWYVVIVPELEIPSKTAAMYGRLGDDDFSDGSTTRQIPSRLEAGSAPSPSLMVNAFERALGEHEAFRIAARALEHAGARCVLPTGAGPALYTVCESFEAASRVVSRLGRGSFQVHMATSIDPGVNDSRLHLAIRG